MKQLSSANFQSFFILILLSGASFSSVKAAEPGTLDLANLQNYANQPVPKYINATPGKVKDNTGENPITDIGATLGRVLFYDKNLSTTNTVSCASCHQQEKAFSDPAQKSQGVAGQTARHSPRLINARFSEETRFRWDEAAGTLEEQMTTPVRNPVEIGYSGADGNPTFKELITKLEGVKYYAALFNLAFGDPEITEKRMQLALA
ncbi:cytochrome-c peroxidase [Verrucomicrobiales bacterium]|nr:cytochrome-c peroxidase [Verrucomicrobiales bacterium]MDC0275512.1 cytochrome-c peroxidase [Verrucomicrobiales bacterium]